MSIFMLKMENEDWMDRSLQAKLTFKFFQIQNKKWKYAMQVRILSTVVSYNGQEKCHSFKCPAIA